MEFNFEKFALQKISGTITIAWDTLYNDYGFVAYDTNDVLSEFKLNPLYADLDSYIYEQELKEPWLNIRDFDGTDLNNIDPENADNPPYTNDEQGATNCIADYLPSSVVRSYVQNWLDQRLNEVRDEVFNELVQEFQETSPYNQLSAQAIQEAISHESSVGIINAISDETFLLEMASRDGLDDLVE